MIVIITGGIGSGKSVVSEILRIKGYQVYDCDSRAKHLMNESEDLRRAIIDAFGENSYTTNGTIDRAYLSSVVFGNKDALQRMNDIVHPAVKDDIRKEYEKLNGATLFVETALYKESGLSIITDYVWVVDAPVEMRLKRVMKRNSATEQEVRARISSQNIEYDSIADKSIILNDEKTPLLPQIEKLAESLTRL